MIVSILQLKHECSDLGIGDAVACKPNDRLTQSIKSA